MPIANNYPTVAPTLNLDFANSQSLDPRISYSRATTGTYYDGDTSVVAEQNLALQSQFAASWATVDSSLTANTTTAPSGATTAATLQEGSTTSTHHIFQLSITASAATTYTASVFGKLNTAGRYITLSVAVNAGIWVSVTLDPSTGTITSVVTAGTTISNPSATVSSVGSGWYRVSLTFTYLSSAALYVQAGLSNVSQVTTLTNSGFQVYAGDNSSSAYIWGAQLEPKSGASGYLATTTSPLTNYIPRLLTAPINEPRFDFNPVTRQSLGLLMEQQSTNLVTYSSEFDNAYWGKSGVTVVANQNIAPDGTLSAELFYPTSTGYNYFYPAFTFANSTTYTYSIYAKAAGKNWLQLKGYNTFTPSFPTAYFDLTNGVVGTTSNATATITAVGNGWYRCSIVVVSSGTSGLIRNVAADGNGNELSTASGTSGIYIWGAQLEATAFPTSYIPTVASQVTRAADAARITGTNFSSWFNNQQGTAYCSFDTAGIASPAMAYWGIDNGASNGYILYKPATNQMTVIWGSPSATLGTLTANTTQQTTFSYNNISSIAGSGSLNGATAVSISSPTQLSYVPTQLSLGAFQTSANPMTGHIRKFAYYPIATTATNLQALTGS